MSPGGGSSRDSILARVARATASRPRLPHPGALATPVADDPIAAFVKCFTSSGGEVVQADRSRAPGEWLADFLRALAPEVEGVAVGPEVPAGLRPGLPEVPAGLRPGLPEVPAGRRPGLPEVPAGHRPGLSEVAPAHAGAGVSVAWGAVAETGSLILPSPGGRAVQLLPPVHVVWVPEDRVFARMEDALAELRGGLPATVGLHSGPSKSADIGRTVVTGVHGPGRCIAVFIPALAQGPVRPLPQGADPRPSTG